ncbi:MAG: TonB-dependent receptor [Congregibacter sp.]
MQSFSFFRAELVILGVSSTLVLSAATAVAQPGSDVTAGADVPLLEEVVVTGSLVRRADYVSPSPVFTIERDTLLRNGTPTLSEYLNRTPQFTPAFDGTSSNPGSGRGEVNLRGLGSNRSLVLLDGQRLGPFGSDGAVDINMVPTALVERVEVLTGGASSVYGSDAMAGAVNIMLRRDFEGFEVGGGYSATERGDGDTWDVSLVGGTKFAGGRGSISGFVSRSDRAAVGAGEREYSRVPLSENFATGELLENGSPVTPGGWIPIPAVIDGVFGADGVTFAADGTAELLDIVGGGYNFAEFQFLLTPLERDTAAVFAEYELGAGITASLDLLWAQTQTRVQIAPLPAFGFVTINLDNPFLSPQARDVIASNYDPQNTGFYIGPFGTRLNQLGPRFREDERETSRVSFGLSGGFGDRGGDWTWDARYTGTSNTAGAVIGDNLLLDNFNQSFLVDPATGQCFDASRGCVAADWFGPGRLSAEAVTALRGPTLRDSARADQDVFQLIARGTLNAPGDRAISLAVGAEYREDSSRYRADPLAASGQIVGGGFAGQSIDGSFDVTEFFVEAVVPVLEGKAWARELSLDLGARYSDYSTAGEAPSWKIGLNWEPVDGLRFRAMSQRAVRAPNVDELFDPVVREISSFALFTGTGNDPCSASEDPVGNGFADLCLSQGLSQEQLGVFESNPFYPRLVDDGGNLDLEAEEADTFTIGVTWQPDALPGLSLALDYYSIEIDNAISEFGERDLLLACFQVNDPNSQFCQNAQRDASGNIAVVRAGPLNAAALTAKGIDLQIDYLWDLPDFAGRASGLRLSFIGNHAAELGFQSDPASSFVDCAGFFGTPCNQTSTGSNPEYRATTTLAWDVGNLTTEVVWRWISNMNNANVLAEDGFADFVFVPKSGDEHYGDLNFTWRPRSDIDVFAGITNIGDHQPPILGFNAQQNNTIPNLYDALGRRFHASLRVRF